MSLRTRLLAGYLVFIAALVLLGAWGAWRLREMGGVSRRIISNNYDSVVAAQEMKESLERQDSAALFALLGAREKAIAQLHEHRERFDQNFQKAANNITELGEPEAIEAIRADRDTYYKMFDAFMGRINGSGSSQTAPPEGISQREEYFTKLEPQFNKLRAECEHLLQLNQRAMVAKSEAASGVAQLWFYRTLLIAGVLVAAGLFLAFFLSNRIVEPLRQLTATTVKIAGGDLNAKVAVNSRDEVGVLAAEYNRMAERIRQLRTSDMGKLLVAQQTTEAAIDSLYDPVIVTDAEGCVTKLNPAAGEDCERLDKLMRDLLDLSKIEAGESQPTLEVVKTRDFVIHATEELKSLVESKGLSFRVLVPAFDRNAT